GPLGSGRARGRAALADPSFAREDAAIVAAAVGAAFDGPTLAVEQLADRGYRRGYLFQAGDATGAAVTERMRSTVHLHELQLAAPALVADGARSPPPDGPRLAAAHVAAPATPPPKLPDLGAANYTRHRGSVDFNAHVAQQNPLH